jgi:hypothetical protein
MSLSNTQIATNAQVGDIHKARLLLKSVRDTNPKHGPGWITGVRVKETAGNIVKACKLIQEGCDVCPETEDVASPRCGQEYFGDGRTTHPHVRQIVLEGDGFGNS